jgi:hypothetical protein
MIQIFKMKNFIPKDGLIPGFQKNKQTMEKFGHVKSQFSIRTRSLKMKKSFKRIKIIRVITISKTSKN